MKIEKIHGQNFKGFRDIDLDIGGKSTVLFGINGVGKSSVLALINYMFRPICYRLNPSQGIAFSSITDDILYYGKSELSVSVIPTY